MLIKKSFFVLFFSLCVFSISFAGIRNIENKSYEDAEIEQQNKTTKGINVYDNTKNKHINVDKYYLKARNAYWTGNMDEAQIYLDAILNVNEEHQKAYELRNKIILLEEKISFLKKEIINTYSIELKRTLKESNYYEGFLFINKILELSPNENVVYSKSRLEAEVEATIQLLDTNKDKRMFKDSVEYFSKGKFSKAKFIIDNLSEKYPKFLAFKGVAEMYQFEEKNNIAVEKYYKYALDSAKTNHIYKAKNYIELAYGINRNNMKVLILMEQINMELM